MPRTRQAKQKAANNNGRGVAVKTSRDVSALKEKNGGILGTLSNDDNIMKEQKVECNNAKNNRRSISRKSHLVLPKSKAQPKKIVSESPSTPPSDSVSSLSRSSSSSSEQSENSSSDDEATVAFPSPPMSNEEGTIESDASSAPSPGLPSSIICPIQYSQTMGSSNDISSDDIPDSLCAKLFSDNEIEATSPTQKAICRSLSTSKKQLRDDNGDSESSQEFEFEDEDEEAEEEEDNEESSEEEAEEEESVADDDFINDEEEESIYSNDDDDDEEDYDPDSELDEDDDFDYDDDGDEVPAMMTRKKAKRKVIEEDSTEGEGDAPALPCAEHEESNVDADEESSNVTKKSIDDDMEDQDCSSAEFAENVNDSHKKSDDETEDEISDDEFQPTPSRDAASGHFSSPKNDSFTEADTHSIEDNIVHVLDNMHIAADYDEGDDSEDVVIAEVVADSSFDCNCVAAALDVDDIGSDNDDNSSSDSHNSSDSQEERKHSKERGGIEEVTIIDFVQALTCGGDELVQKDKNMDKNCEFSCSNLAVEMNSSEGKSENGTMNCSMHTSDEFSPKLQGAGAIDNALEGAFIANEQSDSHKEHDLHNERESVAFEVASKRVQSSSEQPRMASASLDPSSQQETPSKLTKCESLTATRQTETDTVDVNDDQSELYTSPNLMQTKMTSRTAGDETITSAESVSALIDQEDCLTRSISIENNHHTDVFVKPEEASTENLETNPTTVVTRRSVSSTNQELGSNPQVSPSSEMIVDKENMQPRAMFQEVGREVAKREKSSGVAREGSVRRGKWSLGVKIGSGSFGVVHMGMNTQTGQLMAVKTMELDPSIITDVKREVQTLRILKHENIVRYLGAERAQKKLHIFQEWVPGGSLTTLLKKFGSFSTPVVRSYLSQVLNGLAYLHRNDILHRDIKGGNILVNDRGVVKLADFGAAKKLANRQSDMMQTHTVKGTPYFMAPEVFEEKYASHADVWSAGCVAFQMVTGSPPWKAQGYVSCVPLYNHLMESDGPPPIPWAVTKWTSTDQKGFWLLLTKCFSRDPKKRPAAEDLLQDGFFFNGDDEASQASSMQGTLFSPDTRAEEKSDLRTPGILDKTLKRKNQTPPMPSISPPLRLEGRSDIVSPLFNASPCNPSNSTQNQSDWPNWAADKNGQGSPGEEAVNPFRRRSSTSPRGLHGMVERLSFSPHDAPVHPFHRRMSFDSAVNADGVMVDTISSGASGVRYPLHRRASSENVVSKRADSAMLDSLKYSVSSTSMSTTMSSFSSLRGTRFIWSDDEGFDSI